MGYPPSLKNSYGGQERRGVSGPPSLTQEQAMRLNKYTFFIPSMILLLAGWVFAQEDAPISIASSVDKATIRIGDLIQYQIIVTHAPDVQIQLPGEGANLGGFDIRAYEAHEPRKENGMIITESAYTISTFFTGEFDIPPTAVLYTLPGDTISQILMTEPIHIVVESVKPSEEGDIRDIKSPAEIPRNWWILIRWIGLGLFVLLSIVLGYIGYRRRKAGMSLLPFREAPPRPPHEVALEALGKLDPAGLDDPVKIKWFYSEVSEIIRRYLEGRYYVMALEMTTFEVLDGLKNVDVETEIQNAVRQFLEPCDLVKFAKFIPVERQHVITLQQAFDIVNRTKIVIIESELSSEITETEVSEPVVEAVPIETEEESK
ncbi:hypothetical protein HQ585_15135 [candidate division KSB1 bacterium]|nr:hypothetical protein [candidate division KSB1 bacterium]